MNIFALDKTTSLAASYHCDKHLIKMILETAQLLSTAHRIIDGKMEIGKSKTGRKAKRWVLPDSREQVLYSATHINHPSAVWCRQNTSQYLWLWNLMHDLCKEYTRCFGKVHKCEESWLLHRLSYAPENILVSDNLTYPTPAMPEECKVLGDVIQSYRNYYFMEKSRMFTWTNRPIPQWLIDMLDESGKSYSIEITETKNADFVKVVNKVIIHP